MKRHPAGLTLVETIVTVSIIAILGTFGLAGYRKTREKARTLVEINAARNLITGYLSNAAENNGQLLPGYKIDATATDLEGKSLYNPVNARYPYRLAPSIPQIRGVIFCNGNEALLDRKNGEYNVSLRPNLGINANLVGGFFGGDSLLDPSSSRITTLYGKFYLSNLAESDDPGKQLVFASARHAKGEPGYFQVKPPRMTGKVWSGAKFTEDTPASEHGYVDFRWSGRAVTAMLGGNIELRNEEELQDMRLWSPQAARTNDPNFTIKRQ